MAEFTLLTIVLAVGGVFFAIFKLEELRVSKLFEVADRLGFRFQGHGRGEHSNRFTSLPLFQLGKSRQLRNCLIGKLGERKLTIGEYSYSIGYGEDQQTYSQTIAMVSIGRPLPDFAFNPNNFVSKIASSFGYQDFDFTNYPHNSPNYLSPGSAEHSIQQTFSPSVIKFFEDNPGWCVEASGDLLLIYRISRLVPARSIPAFIQEVNQIVEQLG